MGYKTKWSSLMLLYLIILHSPLYISVLPTDVAVSIWRGEFKSETGSPEVTWNHPGTEVKTCPMTQNIVIYKCDVSCNMRLEMGNMLIDHPLEQRMLSDLSQWWPPPPPKKKKKKKISGNWGKSMSHDTAYCNLFMYVSCDMGLEMGNMSIDHPRE